MGTVKLVNVNPLGQVDLPLIARQGEPFGEHGKGCLEPGEVFEVDETLAGRPPKLDEHGQLAVDEDGNVVDPGTGLLAQHGNYELVQPGFDRQPPARPTATDAIEGTE